MEQEKRHLGDFDTSWVRSEWHDDKSGGANAGDKERPGQNVDQGQWPWVFFYTYTVDLHRCVNTCSRVSPKGIWPSVFWSIQGMLANTLAPLYPQGTLKVTSTVTDLFTVHPYLYFTHSYAHTQRHTPPLARRRGCILGTLLSCLEHGSQAE